MGKEVIKITEGTLKEIISESVRRILKEGFDEISKPTLDAAASKASPSWYDWPEDREGYHNADDVIDAIRLIRDYLNQMEESFKPLHGQEAMSYYFQNHKEPSMGVARQCQEYLDYIEKFVQRKSAQAENLEKGAEDKKKEYANALMQYMNKWNGFKWDTSKPSYQNIYDFADTLGEDEWNGREWVSEFDKFVDSIQDSDIRAYLEEYR